MNNKILDNFIRMQDELNTEVHPTWRKQNFQFLLAAMLEGAEAIDHIGWKWWKQQKPNYDQYHLELVDIWHFLLSQTILDCDSVGNTKFVLAGLPWKLRKIRSGADPDIFNPDSIHWEQIKNRLVLFVSKCGALSNLKVVPREQLIELLSDYVTLLHASGLSEQRLWIMYFSKNILNIFRQRNGYKDGTYQKNWGGKEDNEVLLEQLLPAFDIDDYDMDFFLDIMDQEYKSHL